MTFAYRPHIDLVGVPGVFGVSYYDRPRLNTDYCVVDYDELAKKYFPF